MKNKNILTVASHPDDEILGCAGTIARLTKDKFSAYTLILGEGLTSRDNKRDVVKRKKQIAELKKQAIKANKIIGVKDIFFYNLPDNRFDTIPLVDIVKIIEEIKNQIKPDVIFTHYEKDLNIDHQITYKAVITATRPLMQETVKEIYSFEIPSSTEWSYPLSFSPDIFFNIDNTIDLKLKAMNEYKYELKRSLHPRSLESLRLNAKYWGMKLGLKYAEVFKCIRIIR